MDSAPNGSVGFANGSGWMKSEDFVRYISHFIRSTKTTKESPALLLIDNHSSHLSIEALDLAAANGLTILTFPPHCSHKMQPLDVSVYGPVKGFYHNECTTWLKTHAGKILDIRHIPGLVSKSLDLACGPRNIKAGFAATGVYPPNRNVFQDSDFVQAVMENENVVEEENVIGDLAEAQQRIVISDLIQIGAHEEIETSVEPSTSGITIQSASGTDTPLVSGTSVPFDTVSNVSMSSILEEIGPVQPATPQKKSNRGRKPLRSAVVTSPEFISAAKAKEKQRIEKAAAVENRKQEKAANAAKKAKDKATKTRKTMAKRAKKGSGRKRKSRRSSSSSDDEAEVICIICGRQMPQRMSRANSITCMECTKPAHLSCANPLGSYFLCTNCDSDEDMYSQSE